MRISILYNKESGCDYHRLLLPSYYFKLGIDDSIRYTEYNDKTADTSIFECDVLFISRMPLIDWDVINKLREKIGFKVVVDVDDYHSLLFNHIYYRDWIANDISNKIIQSVIYADFVFVTNEQLYNVYSLFNKNIEIIPNALPFDKEPFVSHPIEHDLTRFIYVAGASHYNDLNSIRGFFKRIGSDSHFVSNAKIVICGYTNPNNDKRNVWHSIEKLVEVSKVYERRNSLPLLRYMDHYNYGDVAFAPLENNFFNTCKSNLKFIEASAMKKPFICSDILPYTIDKDKTTCATVYCANTKEWYNAFKFFINNKNAIEDKGNANYEYAKLRYNITDANSKRMDIFNKVINS